MNLFSCICLTYGRVPQLQEAIESFRRQQCSWNTELVILNTLPEQKLELDPFDFPNVHIFNLEKRPPNLGAARNLAIAMANGTHIVTWDDDDLHLPGYLQQFVRVFEREADLHWAWQNRQFYMEKRQFKKLTDGTFNTVAFTKSAWESLGGYGQINVGEDRDFVMRLTVKHSGTKAEIDYSETGFIYCWGNGVYHISGMGNDGKTKANSWERSRVDVQSKLKRGVIPSGTIRLQPGWTCDYIKLAQEFLIKERLSGEPINGLGVVLLGRYGDIINALPILKRLHESGENPHLVVASEFADVLEGVSYVTPFPIKLRIDQLSEAMAIAKSRFKSVLRLQIYGKDHKQDRLTEAYNLETWREAGMELDFHNAEIPPVFDRRNSARESALIRKMFITEKPKLITNLTGGVTSQCTRGPAILGAIKETFGKTHEVVEIGRLKLHRIYDLLAIMERARLIISVDTSTLHLAAATGTPVIALVNKNPWLGSAVRFNAVARIAYPEATSKRVIAEVANFLAPKLDERPAHTLQPFVSAIIAVYKPNVAKLNRCLKAVLSQVGEVVVCGDMDTPWPIAGILSDEKIKLVRHPGTATGYGKKATFGAERSCGKLLLFLNDDVYLDGDVVATLAGEMFGDVAIVTHLLRYMDGTIQYAGKVRHGNGFVHVDLRAEKSRYSGPVEQESACGASMLVRRDVFFDVGGFDHRYLLYAEDDDLAMMIRERGWRISFTPLASGLHEEHTSTSITPRWQGIMAESNAKFAAKWRGYFESNPKAYIDNPAPIGAFKFKKRGSVEPRKGSPIIVRRKMAAGDVLLITPVLVALAKENPNSDIFVETEYPELMRGNPLVRLAAKRIPIHSSARLVDLTMAYESRPHLNYLAAYAEAAQVTLEDRKPKLYWSDDRKFALETFGDELRWCIINTVNPDTNRQWPLNNWAPVVRHLHDLGFKVAEVGKYAAAIPGCDMNLTGKTTVHQLAALIEFCKLFIGVDSLPLHIACATETTAIGLFGVTLPSHVLSVPDSVHSIVAEHPFTGARHKLVTDTIVACDSNPMDAITPAHVIQEIDRIIYG